MHGVHITEQLRVLPNNVEAHGSLRHPYPTDTCLVVSGCPNQPGTYKSGVAAERPPSAGSAVVRGDVSRRESRPVRRDVGSLH